jgi:hypothetical protein
MGAWEHGSLHLPNRLHVSLIPRIGEGLTSPSVFLGSGKFIQHESESHKDEYRLYRMNPL